MSCGRAFVCITILCAGLAHLSGCYGDTGVFDKYVGKDGYLQTCRGICMIGGASMATHVKKEHCSGDNTVWIEENTEGGGFCLIRIESDCNALKNNYSEYGEARWEPYDFQVVQFGADEYARFMPSGDYNPHVSADERGQIEGTYVCGTFDDIAGGDGQAHPCSEAQRAEIAEAFKGTICPLSAHHCSTVLGFNNAKGEPVGICSRCASDQAMCNGKCVSIFTSDYCGSCAASCSGNQFCEAKNGYKSAKCVDEELCTRNSDGTARQGYRLCTEEKKSETAGGASKQVQSCVNVNDDITCGGCVPPAKDITGDGTEAVGKPCATDIGESCINKSCLKQDECPEGTLKCYCSEETQQCSDKYIQGSGDKVQCIDPKDASTCGATSCSDIDKPCASNKVCAESASEPNSYRCECSENTRWIESYNRCMGPNDNETCGMDAGDAASEGIACNTEISVCRNGTCQCFLGAVLCEDSSGAEHCVLPNDPQYCGASISPETGQCEFGKDYETCGANQSCVKGRCECNAGYAACGLSEGESSQKTCIATSEGDSKSEAYKYCGAKGDCNSSQKSDSNYRGADCRDLEADYCAKSGADSVCQCATGQVMCNGKCIDPLKNADFCGADAACESYESCRKRFTGSFCNAGKCTCPENTEEVLIDGKIECRDIRFDAMCCGKTDEDGKVVCANDCIKENKACYYSECVDACPDNMVRCGNSCISKSKLSELHLVYAEDENKEGKCSCKQSEATESDVYSYMTEKGKFINYCDSNNNMADGCEGILNDDQNCGKCANEAKEDELANCASDSQRTVCGYNSQDQGTRECVCPQPEDGSHYVSYCKYGNGTCVNLGDYNMDTCYSCKEGYGDADGDVAVIGADGKYHYEGKLINGCEINIFTDENHCGAIGNVCDAAQMHAAEVACVDGKCTAIACETGYGDCDANALGCESDFSLPANCRLCGATCIEGQTCELNGCKFGEGGGCSDCSLQKKDCADGLKLWRKRFIVQLDQYICSANDPGSLWHEVK